MVSLVLRRWLLAGGIAVAALAPRDGAALVWPDVPERIERDLGAPDPATRRSAAQQIAELGPTRGGPLVMRALGDADDEVKLAAAETAVRLRVEQATDEVLGWLGGGARDARLRRKACEVARALPNPRAVAPLARTLGDPDPEVRQAAADALGHQASPDAVPPLLGKLDDPHPAVRVAIVASLARLGDPRAVVPLVGKAQDSAQEVRQAVARALGDLGDLRASQALLLQLRDNNNDVRRDALSALGRLRAPDAVDVIAPFVTEHVPQLRQAALVALGQIGTKESVRVLVSALGSLDDAGGGLERTPVREALVAAGKEAVAQLHTLLEGSPSAPVATSAAWVLGQLRAKEEAPTLVAAMRRGALPTAAALDALAGAGTMDSVAVALEFVGDPSPVVRGAAVRAAAKLLDPERPDGRAVEPLAAALRDARPTPAERAELATLLGRTGAPRAAPVLLDLTSARDEALKLAAIDALGMLGPAGADPALLDKLESPDPAVRLHTAVALGEAGGDRIRDALLALLDKGGESDRTVVLSALGGVLSRAPSDAAVAKLGHALELAAGPERDAFIVALGRDTSPSAVRALATVAGPPDVDDRRAVATVLAAHPRSPEALALARTLLGDPDTTVRAQAAWTLGTLGDATSAAILEPLAAGPDIDPAIDATAAIGRIAARAGTPDVSQRLLCPRITDARAYVRANALAGLALAGARCDKGDPERRSLLEDPSDAVRAAAALAVARSPSAEDKRALDRCAATDRSGAVVHRCKSPPVPGRAARVQPVEIYVVPEGATLPHPRSAYAVELADGLLHVGVTDRRGAVFDPASPEGELSLRRSSILGK
jgi:HEAT repeat protein